MTTEINKLTSLITCPISRMIYRCPVVASDGIIYEKNCIQDWLKKSSTSPMTRKFMNNCLIETLSIKHFVDYVLSKYPYLKQDQYTDIVSIETLLKSNVIDTSKLERCDFISIEPPFDVENLLSYNTESTLIMLFEKCINLNYAINKTWLKKIFSIENTKIKLVLLSKIENNPLIILPLIALSFPLDYIKNYIEINNVDLETIFEYNEKLIHIAIGSLNIELIDYLLDCNVDLEYINKDNMNPLQCALSKRSAKIALKLIEKNVDLERQGENNMRPIHLAIQYGFTEVALKLIEKNVDLECQGQYNMRPIHYALEYSTDIIALKLIEKNVDLECQCQYKMRPIHYALKHSTDTVALKLIEKNVDLECQCQYKMRPIHYALKHSTDIVALKLIEKNVDLEIKDSFGIVPIEIAVKFSSIKVMQKFIDKKMDLRNLIRDSISNSDEMTLFLFKNNAPTWNLTKDDLLKLLTIIKKNE